VEFFLVAYKDFTKGKAFFGVIGTLRWLTTIYSTCALMDQYYHPILAYGKRMVSNKCRTIGELAMIIYLTEQVTIEIGHNKFSNDWAFVCLTLILPSTNIEW